MSQLHFEIFLGCWPFGSWNKLYQLNRADAGNGKLMWDNDKSPRNTMRKKNFPLDSYRSRNLGHPHQEHSKARCETTSQVVVHDDSSGSSQNGLGHIFSSHFVLSLFSYQCFEYTKILSHSFLYMQNEWIFILKVSFFLFPQQQQQQQEIGNTNTVVLSCLIIGH